MRSPWFWASRGIVVRLVRFQVSEINLVVDRLTIRLDEFFLRLWRLFSALSFSFFSVSMWLFARESTRTTRATRPWSGALSVVRGTAFSHAATGTRFKCIGWMIILLSFSSASWRCGESFVWLSWLKWMRLYENDRSLVDYVITRIHGFSANPH